MTTSSEEEIGRADVASAKLSVDASAPSPAEILLKAAELIEPEGAWIQGRLLGFGDERDDDEDLHPSIRDAKCFCAIGAINRALGEVTNEELSAYRLMVERAIGIPTVDELGVYGLAAWNDAEERTQAEVVAALRSAAALAQAEEA